MRRLPLVPVAAAAHELARRTEDGIAFHDPPPPDTHAVKVAIARVLVRADRLPVPVPALGLDLVDVSSDGRAIDLVFGSPDPVASIRIDAAESARVVEIASAARHRARLDTACERIARATSRDKLDEARALARDLGAPADVPMSFLRQVVSGVSPPTGLVRVGFHCNQDCGMCWQGRSWGRYDGPAILQWIEDLARAGVRRLLLSGGEPTLDRRLVDYVAHARAHGMEDVTLETNAILAARDDLAIRLRDAGLSSAFVSLHSPDATVSDRITRAPGTHARTVRGVHALLAAGVPVKLNAVLTREGIDHVAGLPDFVRSEFGDHPLLRGLMLSFPTAPFDPALRPEIVPDPASLRAALGATIARAFAIGLPLDGLDGPCGPPLCAFDADPRITALVPVPAPVSFRRFLPPCEQCSVRHACLGVHEISASLHGDAAVRPV